MAPKLSVVINTYNEATILARALNSVKNIADEIVIVDTESTDNVKEVANKFGAKLFDHKYVTYVEPIRNFAISKAANEWVLVLDPDEEISTTLAKKIKEIIKKNEADYYRIPRKNIIFGKWMEHTLWWPDYQIRLFKKGSVNWSEEIHAVPVTFGKGSDIEAVEKLSIVHHNYDYIEQFIEKLNRYTSVQSSILINNGYKFDWKDLMSKPFKEFINRYFTGQGYKDGVHGLLLSLMQGFSELCVYAKVWQSEKFKESDVTISDVITEMKSKEKDLHYWQNDTVYKETGDLSARIRRKLHI